MAQPQQYIQTVDALIDYESALESAIAGDATPGALAGGWTAEYRNADTGKAYREHRAVAESGFMGDTPRQALLKGGEGCVAAGTLIEGVPAAEWIGGQVKTLYGWQESTAAYRKGRAALYRVRLKSGRAVEVTLDHRFLTPSGWYPLRYLSVGSLLAVRDSGHDRGYSQRAIDYRGDCLSGLRPYDELPTPLQVDAPNRLPQLASFLFSEYHPESYGLYQSDRFYSADDLHLSERCLLASGGEYPQCQIFCEGTHLSCRTHGQQQQATTPIGRVLLLSEGRRREVSSSSASECQLYLGDTSRRQRLFSEGLQSSLLNSLLNGDQVSFDIAATSLFPCQNEWPFSFQPSVSKNSDRLDYTTYWDYIDDISFQADGDFYDLTVPFAEHYEAQGILHHNSGKSTAGVVKDLERLRRGMSGIIGSSDLQHFKKSLWPEFRRWCPVDAIVESQRYRLRPSWEPSQMFTLTFINGAQLSCGGFDDPTGWEGPNVNFAHWDEARRHKTPAMLKVLAGRVRIPGPDGEPPQLYLTTTPAKHWLFDYFGPLIEDDPLASFKADALVITLLTSDNEVAGNLSAGFTEQRGQSLTESEKRVLLLAEWEDVEDVSRFLSSIIWWDSCKEEIAPATKQTPLVLAADGAYAANGDTFGLVGMSAHPNKSEAVAVRLVRAWKATGTARDFDEIEAEIRSICKSFNVLEIFYDPYQLHQMMGSLQKQGVAKTTEFNQGKDRLIADKALLDMIVERRIAHDGNIDLRQHLDNADKRKAEDNKCRIVKRNDSLKIDLAVCLSMAAVKAVRAHKSQWA